jgi:hypothetical protein
MVKLEEVADEDLVGQQDGPIGGEDDWDTDSGTAHVPSLPVLPLTHTQNPTYQTPHL